MFSRINVMKTIALIFSACAVILVLGGCASCPCQGSKPAAAQAGAASAYAALEPGWTIQSPGDLP